MREAWNSATYHTLFQAGWIVGLGFLESARLDVANEAEINDVFKQILAKFPPA